MSLGDFFILYCWFLITIFYIDLRSPDPYNMDFIMNVQDTAYQKGVQDGRTEANVVTVYLCRDWVPTVGYKAWRQCNTDYVIQQELEEAQKELELQQDIYENQYKELQERVKHYE